MAGLLAKYKSKVSQFTKGQRVMAKLLSKTSEALIFDVGGKSEGIVKEKAYTDAKEFIEGLKVGDTVEVTVLVPETRDGITILALKDAMKDVIWGKLEDIKNKGESVPVMGREINASGVLVDVLGIEGFIPMSQVGVDASKNLDNLVGKYFKAKLVELNKANKKVVLSEKEVSEASDIKLAKEALKKIKEGEVYDGEVSTVASFGVFVKINVGKAHVEGLVHVSEISYSKVQTPSEVLKVGDKVKVRVLNFRDNKLSLSIKQAGKDPWSSVEDEFKKDTKIAGMVTRISDFGVFVLLKEGVEGLIHITKIPPTQKLAVGQEVKCVVEDVNIKDKRISLGLVLTSVPLGYK